MNKNKRSIQYWEGRLFLFIFIYDLCAKKIVAPVVCAILFHFLHIAHVFFSTYIIIWRYTSDTTVAPHLSASFSALVFNLHIFYTMTIESSIISTI